MRDVIVVGAGGGGAVVAKELAARGLDVLVLEAGPGNEHPEKEWTRLENDANLPFSGYFRFGPADRSKPPWQRETAEPMNIEQIAGVGGTTLHYWGNSPRAYPGVFQGYGGRDGAAYDRAHEFPIAYADLVPYYEWVEATLPVQTAALGTKEQLFLEGAERSGLPTITSRDVHKAGLRPQQNAILQPRGTAGRTGDPKRLRYPKAQGCTFCGHCYQGCIRPKGAPRNLFAKRSTDTSYAPMARTASRWAKGGRDATFLTGAFATQIVTDGSSGSPVARGVTWRDVANGEQHTEEARAVVLAAGAIETPRLWLNSALPNPNDWIGRGLTTHWNDTVVGVFPHDTGSSKGPNSAARVDVPGRGCFENFGFGPGNAAGALTFSAAGVAGVRSMVPAHGADTVGRVIGRDLLEALDDVDRLLLVTVITDDHVDPANRVSLSSASSDEHGRIARVETPARTGRTVANREDLARRAIRVLRKAGATRVHRIGAANLLFHIHSTMRMGADPATSVLDEHAESRAVGGVYVADNSALANSLGGPNPTLTTQALATRTAERIATRHFGGEPWVGRESPVVSTADEVTQAVLA